MNSAQAPIIPPSLGAERGSGPIQPVNLGEVHGLQPDLLSYGGYLWTITRDGEIYRFSTASLPEKYGALPGNGFSFPLTIEEDDKEGPVIYVNNDKVVFKFRIFDKHHEEIFRLKGSADQIRSAVLTEAGKCYFLYQRGADGEPFILKCIGSAASEYILENLKPVDAGTQPIQRIGKSLWLLAMDKILSFDSFSLSAPTELSWTPWHILPSRKGLWYSKRVDSNNLGQKQTLMRVTSDRETLEQSILEEDVPVTVKLAIDPQDGRLVVFSPGEIKIIEFNRRRAGLLRGIVDVNNPEAALLISNFLFWFETEDRSLYLWPIGTHHVRKLFTFSENLALSRLFYANGSLFGLEKEEVWRWDLLGV